MVQVSPFAGDVYIAELEGIHADPLGEHIHDLLASPCSLRRAERPESRPEIVVGEGCPHQATDVRDGIRVAEKAANLRRQRPRHFTVCA